MVKSSLSPEEQKRAQEIYKIAREKTPAERNQYLKGLTEIERTYYNKEANKERQRTFLKNPQNLARYNMERKDNIERKRREEKEKMAEQNRKDVKAFREREKELKAQIEAKIKEEEMKKQIIGDILNNIIDTIPKKAQQKRNKEAVKRHRAKKAQGEPVKIYNTRNKAKA
jgi:hypothetical protein